MLSPPTILCQLVFGIKVRAHRGQLLFVSAVSVQGGDADTDPFAELTTSIVVESVALLAPLAAVNSPCNSFALLPRTSGQMPASQDTIALEFPPPLQVSVHFARIDVLLAQVLTNEDVLRAWIDGQPEDPQEQQIRTQELLLSELQAKWLEMQRGRLRVEQDQPFALPTSTDSITIFNAWYGVPPPEEAWGECKFCYRSYAPPLLLALTLSLAACLAILFLDLSGG
jgi:hypothetical protein